MQNARTGADLQTNNKKTIYKNQSSSFSLFFCSLRFFALRSKEFKLDLFKWICVLSAHSLTRLTKSTGCSIMSLTSVSLIYTSNCLSCYFHLLVLSSHIYKIILSFLFRNLLVSKIRLISNTALTFTDACTCRNIKLHLIYIQYNR